MPIFSIRRNTYFNDALNTLYSRIQQEMQARPAYVQAAALARFEKGGRVQIAPIIQWAIERCHAARDHVDPAVVRDIAASYDDTMRRSARWGCYVLDQHVTMLADIGSWLETVLGHEYPLYYQDRPEQNRAFIFYVCVEVALRIL